MNKYKVITVLTTYFEETIEAKSLQEAEDKYNDMMCEDLCTPIEDFEKGSWNVVDVIEEID